MRAGSPIARLRRLVLAACRTAFWAVGALVWVVSLWMPLRVAGNIPGEAIAVIVSPTSPLEAISMSDLRRVFLGEPTETGHGDRFVPLNHPPSSRVRVAFDDRVLSMDEQAVGRYWVDRRIRAQGRPPRIISSALLLTRVVARLEGSISYVPVSQLTAEVKALKVDGKSVNDARYPLRLR